MKKTFTVCLLSMFCFAAFSCSKDVKSPAKVSGTATTTTTNASSPSGGQYGSGHTCGNDHSGNNSGGY
ncbi:hypothetical protein [Parafilimonas terrae]|uniref:Uncharacterized protein n=1 Tax=Parafilimonas terrae TaxID=1465490 RepID=A0A1I5UY98_9BACT|nr:hypothetical protein [Parafilimonas terrae]SFQ00189.1 hypothetical protein SAMN05444277_104105 [Parafilimonas terrae]